MFADEKGGKPLGTAFFVTVKDPESGVHSNYLVTAKHMLQVKRNSKLILLSKIFLRMNVKEAGTEIGSLSLVWEGPEKTVFTHEEATTDLAVIPCGPDADKHDCKRLPIEYLTTRKQFQKLGIREGSEVFFLGLFRQYFGKQKNYPICRFGRVALMTKEKIPWDGQEMELFLAECASYGGNSGSPVFVYLGIEREFGVANIGPPALKLVGIMKGTYQEPWPTAEIKLKEQETASIEASFRNVGISSVIPSYKLHEILFIEELKKQRDEGIREFLEKQELVR